jgi:hypothetical protein
VVAWTVIPYMVRHWGIGRHLQTVAPVVPLCAAGQVEGCVGGRVGVITLPGNAPVLPAAAGASR